MAYVLGLIVSDGTIEDVRKSSRTCYLAISNIDRPLLLQVKEVLHSEHCIYCRKAAINTFSDGKSYLCRDSYILRVGSKSMFQDLVNLGVTPRKSLVMRFPKIPNEFLCFFLRGYFDGDGCLSTYVKKGQTAKKVAVSFTSGSRKFLNSLSQRLHIQIKTTHKRIYRSGGAFQLSYKKKDSFEILKFMYSNLDSVPFLKRKYEHYKSLNSPPEQSP